MNIQEVWCSCGNCATMPSIQESKCCQETNIVDGKIEEADNPLNTGNSEVITCNYYIFAMIIMFLLFILPHSSILAVMIIASHTILYYLLI
jgi:hypothetical protein